MKWSKLKVKFSIDFVTQICFPDAVNFFCIFYKAKLWPNSEDNLLKANPTEHCVFQILVVKTEHLFFEVTSKRLE